MLYACVHHKFCAYNIRIHLYIQLLHAHTTACIHAYHLSPKTQHGHNCCSKFLQLRRDSFRNAFGSAVCHTSRCGAGSVRDHSRWITCACLLRCAGVVSCNVAMPLRTAVAFIVTGKTCPDVAFIVTGKTCPDVAFIVTGKTCPDVAFIVTGKTCPDAVCECMQPACVHVHIMYVCNRLSCTNAWVSLFACLLVCGAHTLECIQKPSWRACTPATWQVCLWSVCVSVPALVFV